MFSLSLDAIYTYFKIPDTLQTRKICTQQRKQQQPVNTLIQFYKNVIVVIGTKGTNNKLIIIIIENRKFRIQINSNLQFPN